MPIMRKIVKKVKEGFVRRRAAKREKAARKEEVKRERAASEMRAQLSKLQSDLRRVNAHIRLNEVAITNLKASLEVSRPTRNTLESSIRKKRIQEDIKDRNLLLKSLEAERKSILGHIAKLNERLGS